jgi:hypothetical protein
MIAPNRRYGKSARAVSPRRGRTSRDPFHVRDIGAFAITPSSSDS